MNPYLIIGILLATLAGGFKLGSDHELAAQAREDKHVQAAIEAANKASAEAIANIKVVNTTVQNEVQREIRTKTIYADCKHTDDGLRLVNQALTGGAVAPVDSQLPKANGAKR